MQQTTITKKILEFQGEFNLNDAYTEVLKEIEVNKASIRARIYEAIDKGILNRISKGVFINNNIVMIEGNGRDLSFLKDGSIDAIITDHPYDISKSNKGGSRNFATYNCFRYTQEDFNEKARVLKDGHFLVEFIPEENGDNWEYLYQIKEMAKKAGFVYYAKVPWKKGSFISNCGRKSKNTEDVLIFSKGKARSMRPDVKKDLKDPTTRHFMSGAKVMLPTVFDYDKTKDQVHQAEKPVSLLMTIVEVLTYEDELVLDQFAGSGSTGLACLKTNRRSILIEQDQKTYETMSGRIVKELENNTN